jgi:CheY-like chemotaxis protein
MEKVLVIDDDPMVLDVATEVLLSRGHSVLPANSGPEGLRLARLHAPHLILVDQRMPGMDGLTVVARLKEDPVLRKIPVIAFTSGTSLDAERLVKAGCLGYIPKPFEIAAFARVVAEFLAATHGRARAAE